MNIELLLFLLLRFIHPLPADELPYPVFEPVSVEESQPETVVEAPAYVRTETGETIYLEEGQDGTDVDMADLDLYE